MRNLIKKGLFLITIIFTLCSININNIEAKTLSQLEKELSDLKTKYENSKNEKDKTEKEIKETKDKIADIDKQKISLQEEMESLEKEIEQLNNDILEMNDDIKKVMHYYQLSNADSFYLQYLFDAADYTDFIYRFAVVEQLNKYCKDTITKYNNLIDENKKKISNLADKKRSLDALESKLANLLDDLGKNLADITDATIDIKDEIKTIQTSINTYKNTYKCSANEEISTCINRYNSQNAGSSIAVPSASGFYRPVAGGHVTANYGYYSPFGYSQMHYGLDIGIAHGSNVYPIANGTVVRIVNRSSCGGNMVFIAHKVNGKTYTSGYFHLADIRVSLNQIVSYNTVIGRSGGSKYIETWDTCSTGAHLHLQISTGLYMTDYYTYSAWQARSFNPRNLINFPAVGGYISSR